MEEKIINSDLIPDFNKGTSENPNNIKEAFYATALDESDEDVETVYSKIKQELDIDGYSRTILNAQLQWQDEQDSMKKDYLERVITDPSLPPEEKKQALDDYKNKNIISKSLQDKYFKQLSDAEIMQNDWDEDPAELEAFELHLNDIKVQQDFEKVLETAGKALKGEKIENDPDEKNANAKSIAELGDLGGALPLGIDAEFLAYMRMLIGESPVWLDNIYDLFMYDNPDGDQKKTWGQIMEIVTENNQTAWTGEWQTAFDEMLLKMGYNTATINGTFVNKALTTIGEYIQVAAEFINPEDPTKPAVILELLTAVAPVGFKLAHNRKKKRQKLEADKIISQLDDDPNKLPEPLKEEPQYFEYEDEDGNTQVREVNEVLEKDGAKIVKLVKDKNAFKYPTYVRWEDGKLVPKPKVEETTVRTKDPVDPNSPMVTTVAANKKAGTDLIDDTLENFDGTLLHASGINVRQLIHFLTDPMSSVVKTLDFGWHVDVARIKELNAVSKRARELQILNPAFNDLAQRKQYLMDIVTKLNGIKPDIPMVISNTFSIFSPTKSGFFTELAFRKSTVEDYGFREAQKAARQLRESVGPEGQVFIQEIAPNGKSRGNVVNEWDTNNKVKIKASKVNKYRVIWKNDASLYNGYFAEFGKTVSERFKDSTWLGRKIQKAIFGNSSISRKSGPISEWFSAYGSLARAAEYRMNVSNLVKQTFLSRQRDILLRDIMGLNQKERAIFSQVLEYQDIHGVDLVDANTINQIVGEALDPKLIKRLQTGLHQYRRFDKELHYFDNVTYRNKLIEAGYNTAMIIEDTPYAVKENFSVSPDKTPLFFDENGNPVSVAIWDFENKKEVYTFLKPGENTHYVFDADGKPAGQVYRLAKQHPDGSRRYNYGIFGKNKPQSLPNNMLPERPGHVPRMHDEAYTVTAYPKYMEVDGVAIDYRKRDTGPAAILDIDNPESKIDVDIFTDEMKKEKAFVVDKMRAFAQVIALRNSKNDAYRFAGNSIVPNRDFIYVVEKANELQTNQLSDYYIMQERAVTGAKLRGDDVNFEIKSDPFATLMENLYTSGARGIDQLAVDQFKMEWVNTFKDNPGIKLLPNSDLDISIPNQVIPDANPSLAKEASLLNNFPVRIEQIVKQPGNKELYDAAVQSWNKIYVKEMGYAPGSLSTAARFIADKLADSTENVKVLGIPKLNKVIREAQKRPGSVVSIPLKTVTQFRIMFNTIKQLILQPMAALGPLLTVANGNPIAFAKNIKDVAGLATVYYKETGMFKGRVQKDMDAIVDAMWTEDGISNTLPGTKGSLARKDFQLLLQAAKEQGLLDVSDHQFAKGVFVDRIRRLDDGASVVGKGGELLQEFGFSAGELLNRFGMTITALRNFEAKNPKVNWRTQKNLNQIMYDAYQLSGGMTDITAYGWQRNAGFRFLGQFASFGMKMNEAAWNASSTPFNFAQRMQLAAWNVAMWGSAPYGIYSVYEWMSQMWDGKEEAKELGRELEKLPISYWMYNYFGDYIFGTERDSEGNIISSEALPGEVFGPYGLHALGVYGVLFKNIMAIFKDNVKTSELGATINFWKQAGPAYDFMVDIYQNPMELSVQDRAELVAEKTLEIIPVAKGIIRTVIQLNHDTYGRTKSGQEVFGGQTKWETISQNFLSIPNRSQRDTYEQFKKNKTTSEFIREYAKSYMETVYRLKPNMTVSDLKKHIVAAKFHLYEVEFGFGTQEWDEVTDEILRQALRQKESMAQALFNDFKKSHKIQNVYTDEKIQRARELADILKRENPAGARWLDEQVENMEEVNEAYKKGTI